MTRDHKENTQEIQQSNKDSAVIGGTIIIIPTSQASHPSVRASESLSNQIMGLSHSVGIPWGLESRACAYIWHGNMYVLLLVLDSVWNMSNMWVREAKTWGK